MSYYLPLEYQNHYWDYLDQLLKIKLYTNRNSLSELEYEFYEEMFDMIENKSPLSWLFDYIEYKSEKYFKHVSFDWFDHGDMIVCQFSLSEEARDFIYYEYYCDPDNLFNTAELIQNEIEDESFTEMLLYENQERRPVSFSYGKQDDFPPIYLMYINVVNIIETMKTIEQLIIKRLFIYKRILTYYKRFDVEEQLYRKKLNYSSFEEFFLCIRLVYDN